MLCAYAPLSGITKANFYGFTISIVGILTLLFAQTDFIANDIKYSDHEWVNGLTDFARRRTCNFFQYFWPISLDFLVISDCLNRYVIICHPDKTESLTSWKIISVYQIVIALVAGFFSFFFAKMEADVLEPDFLSINGTYNAWLPNLILKIISSSLSSCFFCFFTVKIRGALKKSVQFLSVATTSGQCVERYEKIIRFSTLLCVCVVMFNLILENVANGFAILHAKMTFYSLYYSYLIYDEDVAIYSRLTWKVLTCLKPGFYAIIYLWLKYGRIGRKNVRAHPMQVAEAGGNSTQNVRNVE